MLSFINKAEMLDLLSRHISIVMVLPQVRFSHDNSDVVAINKAPAREYLKDESTHSTVIEKVFILDSYRESCRGGL